MVKPLYQKEREVLNFHLSLQYVPKRREENNMTIEKAQRDFNQVIMRNGFTEAGYTRDTNIIIYHKIWKEDDATLEVRMMFTVHTRWFL